MSISSPPLSHPLRPVPTTRYKATPISTSKVSSSVQGEFWLFARIRLARRRGPRPEVSCSPPPTHELLPIFRGEERGSKKCVKTRSSWLTGLNDDTARLPSAETSDRRLGRRACIARVPHAAVRRSQQTCQRRQSDAGLVPSYHRDGRLQGPGHAALHAR